MKQTNPPKHFFIDKDKKVLLLMKNISKSFYGVKALEKVNLELKRGEIYVLLGENGAGKTTLMKILAGLYIPDEGEILINNHNVSIGTTKDAARLGISIVNQYPQLVDDLTVEENISLALSEIGLFNTSKSIRDKIREISNRYGLIIKPDDIVNDLSFSERQRVEIIKTIIQNSKIIIMDEPTTLLTTKEKKELYRFMKTAKKEGRGIILITHKLDEALEISDKITVLKKGRVVGTIDSHNATYERLVKMMFEKPVSFAIKYDEKKVDTEKILLSIENLEVLDDYGREAVKNVTMNIKEGEIYGLVGIAGNGQIELVEAIYGLRKIKRGIIKLMDKKIKNFNAKEIRRYIAYVPDRIEDAISLDLTFYDNIILKNYDISYSKNNFMIDYRRAIDTSKELIRKFNIVIDSPHSNVGVLSGGNLQKVVLAREIHLDPKLLIVVNPTRALDFKTAEMVYKTLNELRKYGTSILLISEDKDEVLRISDRIAVMYDGKLYEIGPRDQVETETIEMYMVSGKKKIYKT